MSKNSESHNWLEPIGGTRKGKAHKKTVNQDYYKMYKKDDLCIAVVCDGVSSCKHSDIGSKVACNVTLAILEKNFDILFNDPIGHRYHILDSIKQNIEKTQFSIEECATTLSFVAIKDNRYLCGQLGDGIIGCFYRNQVGYKLLPSQKSILENSKTYSIINDSSYLEIKKGYTDEIDAFLLVTDGLLDIVYREDSKYLLQESKNLFNCIFKSLRKYARISSDDITYVALKRENVKLRTKKTLNQWICPCGQYNNFGQTVCPKCQKKYTELYKNPELFEIVDKYLFFASLKIFLQEGNIHKLIGIKYIDVKGSEEYFIKLFKLNNKKEKNEKSKIYKVKEKNVVLFYKIDENKDFVKISKHEIKNNDIIIDLNELVTKMKENM